MTVNQEVIKIDDEKVVNDIAHYLIYKRPEGGRCVLTVHRHHKKSKMIEYRFERSLFDTIRGDSSLVKSCLEVKFSIKWCLTQKVKHFVCTRYGSNIVFRYRAQSSEVDDASELAFMFNKKKWSSEGRLAGSNFSLLSNPVMYSFVVSNSAVKSWNRSL